MHVGLPQTINSGHGEIIQFKECIHEPDGARLVFEGIVQPGSTAIIKASFNPFSPQKFEKSVSLYVDDPEISSASPYMDIVLKGEGLFPRLLFDRKEIILPVVPLNV